ncbi:MAG: aminodeoxychorismate synthase component I [Gammaproteobacteria bacterium]|nr:aminodeoxychorismate synthase component I [Gammaproteobacteria bacterium]MDH5593676.1 aminodeoxychorismate synthase component I [Gammaproteobacteria bacterium]MDH5613814.1 aminodeoxychorismate synthase component I [Gammaproteobacteria bacterium]
MLPAEITTSAFTIKRVESCRDLFPLHSKNRERYPFLLESVAHGTQQASFDILFAYPQQRLELRNLQTLWSDALEIANHDFLSHLDKWWLDNKQTTVDTELPFTGGWFLYLGYELAQQVEPRLNLKYNNESLPVAMAIRIPAAIIRSHKENCIYLIAESGYESYLDVLQQDVQNIPSDDQDSMAINASIEEEQEQCYLSAVERAKQYITDGDIFQANLSRVWKGTLGSKNHDALYKNLRTHNPAPFSGIMSYNNTSVISSSPERLVSVKNNQVQTRPIAGTRPRSNTSKMDNALSDELMQHPKERAEHIMLIDLERNDLGRVCQTGSIEVNELMVLESYAHVHHIVSNVQGLLKNNVMPGEVIRAVFPGGTITGCPKVRCMEIINELEQVERGAYTGSMGYLNRDGSLDLNILIRTIVCEENKITLRAGAGIVADSIPDKELAETRAKARGMLMALGIEK